MFSTYLTSSCEHLVHHLYLLGLKLIFSRTNSWIFKALKGAQESFKHELVLLMLSPVTSNVAFRSYHPGIKDMDLLTEALKAEEWKGFGDPVSREQDVAQLFHRERGRKRKSACSEYELTNANKRLRLGGYGPTEEDYEAHSDKVADEGGDDDDDDDDDEDNYRDSNDDKGGWG